MINIEYNKEDRSYWILDNGGRELLNLAGSLFWFFMGLLLLLSGIPFIGFAVGLIWAMYFFVFIISLKGYFIKRKYISYGRTLLGYTEFDILLEIFFPFLN